MAITLDGTTGITTPGLSLAIENFSTTGNTTLGDASTDTLNVGNGGLVKDSSGRVGIGIASPGSSQGMIQVAGSSQSWFKFYDSAAGWNFGTFYKANGTTALAYLGGGGSAISGGTVDDFVVRSEGNLLFATGGNTERARIDSSGNLGLGVTPSAWANYKAIQLGGGSLSSYSDNNYIELSQNVYYASGLYKYVNTGYASKYQQNTGTHQWYVAASGSANANISFTQAMTLNASGNLGVGITSPLDRLHVLMGTTPSNGDGIAIQGINSGGASSQPGVKFLNNAGTYLGGIYADNGTGFVGINAKASSHIRFTVDNTEVSRFNSTGAFVFAGGTTTADGIGITFPATQSASTNANTLDDYEEGTWTPVIQRLATNPTVTYSFQSGSYVKVGRIVTLTCGMGWSSNSGGSGLFTLSGLPFTNSSSTSNYTQAVCMDYSGITFSAGATSLGGYVNVNTTYVIFTSGGSAVTSAGPTLGSSGYVYMAVTYIASA